MLRRFGTLFLAFGAMLVLSACAGKTTGATNVTDVSATLHASARCDAGESCTWYWEYWPVNLPRSSHRTTWPPAGPVAGPTGDRNLSLDITSLTPNTTYRWVLCASPNSGASMPVYACTGPHGAFGSPDADPPPDFATFTTLSPVTLAEAWDGTTWTRPSSPNPTGAVSSTLSGVSCTSATACTAVGSYGNSSGTQLTLAERWDGTSWTTQPTANPAGAQSAGLSGVSCTSVTACTAVGDYHNSAGTQLTLAERWDGTSWTIQATPNSPGTTGSLQGVSCTAVAACVAVGWSSMSNPPGRVTLAERWDGTSWTIQSTPNPTATSSVSLAGVSCTSATACTAVGGAYDYQGLLATLAERWDGTTWSIKPTPNPAQFAGLSGVSCTSGTVCTAVGEYETNSGGLATLAERWNGATWATQSTPNPTAASSISGVSCTSATACTAVGSAGSRPPGSTPTAPLAERWDGTTWTVQTTPNPSGAADLQGVSCASTTACTAAGGY